MSYHLHSGSALKQCKWNQQKIEYLAYIIFESPTTRNDFFRLDICIYMVEPNEREREKERGALAVIIWRLLRSLNISRFS